MYNQAEDVLVTLSPSVVATNASGGGCKGSPWLAFSVQEFPGFQSVATPGPTTIGGSGQFIQMAVADFNFDGMDDLFVLTDGAAFAATAKDPGTPIAADGSSVAGDPSTGLVFGMPVQSTIGMVANDPVVGDFNFDGIVDVAWVQFDEAGSQKGSGWTVFFASVCPGDIEGNVLCDGAQPFDVVLNPQTKLDSGNPGSLVLPSLSLDFTAAIAAGNYTGNSAGSELVVTLWAGNGVVDLYRFDQKFTWTQVSESAAMATEDGSGTVYAVSARLDWFGDTDQVVVSGKFLGTNGTATLVLSFDENGTLKTSNVVNSGTNFPFNLGLAVGRFGPPPAGTPQINYNLQVAHLRGFHEFRLPTDNPGEIAQIEVFNVDPSNNFELTSAENYQLGSNNANTPPYWNAAFYRRDGGAVNLGGSLLRAGDIQGRSMRLGEPYIVRLNSHQQPYVVLGDPPKHVDYVPAQVGQSSTVVNFSATRQFFSQFDLSSSQNTTSANTTKSSYSWSWQASLQEKFSANIPLVSRISGDFSQAWGKTGEKQTSTANSEYEKLGFDDTDQTTSNDVVIGTQKNFNLYIYPMLGHTVCPASITENSADLSCDQNSDGGCTCKTTSSSDCPSDQNPSQTTCNTEDDCCTTPQRPLMVQLSGPDTVTKFSYAGDATGNVEWYQPIHEPLNVLSRPWTAAQVEAQVPDFLQPPFSGGFSFATDTEAKDEEVNWTVGGSSSKSTGSTSSHSFKTDNSLTVGTPKVPEVPGASVTASFNYNTSKATSSLNSNSMTLTESQGVAISKPGAAEENASLYAYTINPMVFEQNPSPGVIQSIPPGCGADGQSLCSLPVTGLGAGALRLDYWLDVNEGGSWWQTGPYSSGDGLIDIALNHPARWSFVTGTGPGCVTTSNVGSNNNTTTDCVQAIAPPTSKQLKSNSTLLWSSEWYWMRGLLITVDALSGPQRTTATAGDTVYLQARVYNYSQKAMADGTRVHVRFYRQQIDTSTYALIDNSVLIGGQDILLDPIPSYNNPTDNPDDDPNWVLVPTSFDTTGLADTSTGATGWLFWVVAWAENNGKIVKEVAAHGLPSQPVPPTSGKAYKSIANVPLQWVTVPNPAGGKIKTSFTNNVAYFHQVFTVLPPDTTAALPLASQAPELVVENMTVSDTYTLVGGKVIVSAGITSVDEAANGVVVRFFDLVPGEEPEKAFDVENLPYIGANDTYRVEVPFRPSTCGTHEVLMVVAPGHSREQRAHVTVKTACVTYPSAAGIDLHQGEPVTVTWEDFPGKRVRIHLLKGSRYVTRVTSGSTTENDGSYDWTVPTWLKDGDDYRIRVQSTSDRSFVDASDQPFTIQPAGGAEPMVTFPSAPGIKMTMGQAVNITWKNLPGSRVKVHLLEGNRTLRRVTSAGDTENDGVYRWTVPTSLKPGDDYRIKVTSASQSSVHAVSDNPFAIQPKQTAPPPPKPPKPPIPAGEPVVTHPSDAGIAVNRGAQLLVTWEHFPGTRVKLLLYSGSRYVTRLTSAGNTENDGTFTWTVPASLKPRNNYRIKIKSVSHSVSDFSDHPFAVE